MSDQGDSTLADPGGNAATDPITRLNGALEGRYSIVRQIGEGGMAVVYLAKDLRHQRDVALKVLRPELAAVVGAERFLAEIQTTANLKHPHILPLFDSGEADGFLFFVMPYLEGESLRHRIDEEKQLPVEEAVSIASKVAAALQHAHDHGVVHRDIKPGNILLQDGEPIVTDFGIALAVGAAGGSRLTETGLSVGTPFYMSPEQATGDQAIGPASDTYALGCVLYEMLVGDPPYPGSTAQAVLGKIIQGLPVSVTAARRSVPLNVDGAIRKALERLPADRFTGAQAFAKALADPEFRHEDGTGAGVAMHPGAWRTAAVALAGVAFILALALGSFLLRPGEAPSTSRQLLSTEGWTGLGAPFGRMAALSPDGSSMVLPVGTGQNAQLALKRRGSIELTPLPGTEAGRDVTYSPDGEWIAYVSGTDFMKRPIVGGSPVTLAEDADPNVAATAWLDDGTILYEQVTPGAERPQRLVRISEDGGEPLEVVFGEVEGPILPIWVHGLPGARGALVTACLGVTGCIANDTNLYMLDLRSGASELIIEQVVRAWYAPTGHIVYVRADGAVFAVPFDLNALELDGNSVPVLEGARIWGAPYSVDVLLGGDGTLLYVEGDLVELGRPLVWVDRAGREEPVDPNMPSEVVTSLALSPDDRRLAVSLGRDGLPPELWVKELPDGPLTRLTTDAGNTRRPEWSADGATIAYITGGGSGLEARTVRSDGGSVGAYELLLRRELGVLEVLFTADELGLIFREGDTGVGAADLGVVDLETGEIQEGLLASEFNESGIDLSPDGRWLAYVSNLTGRPEVFVRPLSSEVGGSRQVSTNGGFEPLWAHGGRELFYREPVTGAMMVATYVADPAFTVTSREALFDATDYLAVAGWRGYDVTSDDERFVMSRVSSALEEGAARLILVQNWFTELSERTGGAR